MEHHSFLPQTHNLSVYAGDPASFSMAITSGTTITVDMAAAATGVLKLTLSSADTADLVSGVAHWSGVWDCQWFPVGSDPITLVQGKLNCTQDVTRLEAV
jgi:hypothetical protein